MILLYLILEKGIDYSKDMSNYDKLFHRPDFMKVINDFVHLIEQKYYNNSTKRGRPLTYSILYIVKSILHVLKTGCQWYMLPKEFGNWSSLYKHYLKYVKDGLITKLWENELHNYLRKPSNKSTKNLTKQSIDCSYVKSINGCDVIGKNPTDRGRNGSKISLITDVKGVPLGFTVVGANKADHTLMQETINNMKVHKKTKAKLYADKGYSNKKSKECAESNNYKLRCDNKRNAKVKLFKRKKESINHIRYVIEATFSWVKNFKRLILRYDRKAASYVGFLMLSFTLITSKKNT